MLQHLWGRRRGPDDVLNMVPYSCVLLFRTYSMDLSFICRLWKFHIQSVFVAVYILGPLNPLPHGRQSACFRVMGRFRDGSVAEKQDSTRRNHWKTTSNTFKNWAQVILLWWGMTIHFSLSTVNPPWSTAIHQGFQKHRGQLPRFPSSARIPWNALA